MKSIYTVQVFKKNEPSRNRNWGYYFDESKAEKVILNNITDIFECGYYDIGVVIEIPEGIMQLCEVRKCFSYKNMTDEEVTEITDEKEIEFVNNMEYYPFGMNDPKVTEEMWAEHDKKITDEKELYEKLKEKYG